MIRVLLAAYNLFYMLIACLSSVLITNNNRSTHSVQLNTTMGCFINVSINPVGITTMPTIFPKPLKINVRLYCMYALSTIIMHTIWSCLASGFIKHFCDIQNYSAAQSRATRQELHTICEHLLFWCVWCYKSYLVFYFFGMFVFFLCLVPNFASLPGFITNSWFAYGFLSRWYYHLYYPFGTTTTPYMYFTYCYYELYKCITLSYDNYCQLRHIMYEFSV